MEITASEVNIIDPKNIISEALKQQALSIPIALEALLTVIDQIRQLFLASKSASGKIQSGTKQYHGALSARERIELDKSISIFYQDLDRRVEDELSRTRLLEDSTDNSGIYPLASETMIVIFNLILGKLTNETMSQHFGKFENDQTRSTYVISQLRLGQNSARESTLGSAMLPMIVSKFEEFIGALLRAGLAVQPKGLGDLPSIPDDVYRNYKFNISSIDIERWQVDQKIADFLRESPAFWCEKIKKWTRIDSARVGARWPVILEAMNRRNVVVHAGGRVDIKYLRNVSEEFKQGLGLGTYLDCDYQYMDPVLAEIETWAICVASLWAKRFFQTEAVYYYFIVDRVVKLEDEGRWSQALAILEAYLAAPLDSKSNNMELARINRWFCLQEIGSSNDGVDLEISQWRASLSQEILQDNSYVEIGIHALLREYSELVQALRRLGTQTPDRLIKRDYREMPLLKRAMRESPLVKRYLTSAEFVADNSGGPKSKRNRS